MICSFVFVFLVIKIAPVITEQNITLYHQVIRSFSPFASFRLFFSDPFIIASFQLFVSVVLHRCFVSIVRFRRPSSLLRFNCSFPSFFIFNQYLQNAQDMNPRLGRWALNNNVNFDYLDAAQFLEILGYQ